MSEQQLQAENLFCPRHILMILKDQLSASFGRSEKYVKEDLRTVSPKTEIFFTQFMTVKSRS